MPRPTRPRTRFDAAGAFVMPGLWDNHVHFGGGPALVDENRNLLPLYLAHGITTVRDAAGDLSENVLEWRARVADGTLLGPTLFTSGPKLEGIDSIWPGDLEVGSEADVRAALGRLQAMRVDFVKITENTLTAPFTCTGSPRPGAAASPSRPTSRSRSRSIKCPGPGSGRSSTCRTCSAAARRARRN